MLVVVLNCNNSSVSIEDIEKPEDLWDMHYKESECSWMEIDSDIKVMEAFIDFTNKRRNKNDSISHTSY